MAKVSATIRDVAREAAVSVASVSRALNGHSSVTGATRDRVIAAAAKLDYVPHFGARSLTMARTDTIGVVLPDLFGEFFSEIIRGIDHAAHARGLQLLLSNMHGDASGTDLAIRAMRGRVDGLLVMSPSVRSDELAAHLPARVPTVVLGGELRGAGRASLSIGNVAGAEAMVSHLVGCGYRKIAMIAGPVGNSDAEERLAGFRAAIARQVGEADPIIFPGDFREESGVAAAQAIAAAPGRVDAVFAANDMMAVGCLTALCEAGIDVPGQVAVAGFDDVPIARYVRPGLTTMRVHIAELGMRAFDTLAGLLDDPEAAGPASQTLVPELIVRAST